MEFPNKCFVISPIGSKSSSIRKHADKVFRNIIVPASEANGLKAVRADQIDAAGLISVHVLDYLEHSPVAIADLTGINPNVMYELAFRHARQLPVINIALAGTSLPFDIAGQRTIFFSLRDPDSVADARRASEAQIKHALENPNEFTSPLGIPSPRKGLLNEEQTRNLIRLHQGNAASGIYHVIDEVLSEIEDNPESYDFESFSQRIANALMESRKLCAPFDSQKIGNIYRFFVETYRMEELDKAIKEGVRLLLSDKIDANTKRKRLLAYVTRNQYGLDDRVESALQAGKKDNRK